MEIVLPLVLKGVILPLALGLGLVGVAARLTRSAAEPTRRLATGAAAAAGVGLGFFAAFAALGGLPGWPPGESMQWLAWLALGAGLAGMGGAAAERLGGAAAHVGRVALALGLAFLVPGVLLSNLVKNAWTVEEASGHLWMARGALFGAWLLLDTVVGRLSARAGAGLLAFFAAGAAGVVVLGETALAAQLLGAAAAGAGGIALVTVLPMGRESNVRPAAFPIALLAMSAALSAHHLAALSEPALWLVVAAPAGALALTIKDLRPRLPALLADALPVAATLILVGAAAYAAHEAEPPPSEPEDMEIQYGYDAIDVSSNEAPSSTDIPGPDYGALENWKPESKPESKP